MIIRSFIMLLPLAAPFLLIFGPIAMFWWLISRSVRVVGWGGPEMPGHRADGRRVSGLDGPEPPDPPRGWYPDPQQDRQLRWWDGDHWTEHRRPM